MVKVESIYPYTIVEKDGFYGIADQDDNLVVPCVMDEIANRKVEEVGLEFWADLFCVEIVKDGRYGFFTQSGKLIEPVYKHFVIDPDSGDIHVKTDKGFGLLTSPEYVFKRVSAARSLYSEIEVD